MRLRLTTEISMHFVIIGAKKIKNTLHFCQKGLPLVHQKIKEIYQHMTNSQKYILSGTIDCRNLRWEELFLTANGYGSNVSTGCVV